MCHVSIILRTLEEEAHIWEGNGDYFDETMGMVTYDNNNSNTTTAAPPHVRNANNSLMYVWGTTNIKNHALSEQSPASITVKGVKLNNKSNQAQRRTPALVKETKARMYYQ
eukprot:13366566-Ditylum_brightwellii.AAC.1